MILSLFIITATIPHNLWIILISVFVSPFYLILPFLRITHLFIISHNFAVAFTVTLGVKTVIVFILVWTSLGTRYPDERSFKFNVGIYFQHIRESRMKVTSVQIRPYLNEIDTMWRSLFVKLFIRIHSTYSDNERWGRERDGGDRGRTERKRIWFLYESNLHCYIMSCH